MNQHFVYNPAPLGIKLPFMMILFGILMLIFGYTSLEESLQKSETKSQQTLTTSILQPKASFVRQ